MCAVMRRLFMRIYAGKCCFKKSDTVLFLVDVDVFYDLVEKSKKVLWNREDRKATFVLFSIIGYTQRLLALAGERGNFNHGKNVLKTTLWEWRCFWNIFRFLQGCFLLKR